MSPGAVGVLPFISIVTPTLDAAQWLGDCLRSVESQRYPSLEQFIVDGGSKDGTLELARRAPHAVVLERPGLNQSGAINEGLRRARGDVVAWLNADDYYVPGALKIVAHRFAADEAVDVVYGDCEVVGAERQILWYERPGPYNFDTLLRRGNYLAQPAVFFRKRVFEQIGYLDESLDFAMDFDVWLRLKSTHVEYIPGVLAGFRWHATSKTATNTHANWRESMAIIHRHGGGWTTHLAWSFLRANMTVLRQRAMRAALAHR